MGPGTSNGVTGSMGLMADLAPPAGPDPLIDHRACRFGPKLLGPSLAGQWRPRRAVRDGCRSFKAVVVCLLWWKLDRSSLSDTTERASERHRGGLAVCLENVPCLGQVAAFHWHSGHARSSSMRTA